MQDVPSKWRRRIRKKRRTPTRKEVKSAREHTPDEPVAILTRSFQCPL
jgi:hypothetical protein